MVSGGLNKNGAGDGIRTHGSLLGKPATLNQITVIKKQGGAAVSQQ